MKAFLRRKVQELEKKERKDAHFHQIALEEAVVAKENVLEELVFDP